MKKETGDIFRRALLQYKDVFNFDTSIEDVQWKECLEALLNKFIVPSTDKALSKSGIRELAKKVEITLLTVVKEALT